MNIEDVNPREGRKRPNREASALAERLGLLLRFRLRRDFVWSRIRSDGMVRQDGAVEGQNGTKLDCLPENQGKSREINPRAGIFFGTRRWKLRSRARGCTKVT